MGKRVWVIIVLAAVVALAGGTITAQNVLDGQNKKQGETVIEHLNGSGFLTGRIDSHSVEIEIDGEPEAFGLSDLLRDEEFASGPITFIYHLDQNGRSIITEAVWSNAETGTVKTAEGIFNGLADSHTVEIEIAGQPGAFGLEEGISFTGIKEGEPVFIAYRETNGGRQVVIKVERLF